MAAGRCLLVAILCAGVGAGARASATRPVNAARLASQYASQLVKAFSGWEELHDTHAVPGACGPFAFPRRLASKGVSLESRAVATNDLSISGSVAVFPSGSAARKALRDAHSAKHLSCMLSWYEKTMLRDRGAPVNASGQQRSVKAPAALHAGHQTIRLRASSPSWFKNGTDELYEFENAADPRVVYGFDIESSSNRHIPPAIVEKLLAVAMR